MSTQQVLNIPTAVSQATIEQWLKGLEQTTELAFFRRVGGRHGFNVTSRWGTLDNLNKTLNDPSKQGTPANFSNLRLITLKIITSVNHYYSIDGIKSGTVNLIPNIINYPHLDKTFSSVFPIKLDDNTGLPSTRAFHYSHRKMGDGIAVIYSYIILRKIQGRSKLRSNQYQNSTSILFSSLMI
jgi:hypothetical protein